MSKVMKDLKINKNDIKELNKFAYLCSVVTSACGTEEGVKTYSEGQCSFFSFLSSLVRQLGIHCNIVEACISNVMSIMGVRCKRKILFETLVGRTYAYVCVFK